MPSSEQSKLLYEYLLRPECYVGVTQFTRRLLKEGKPVSKKSERLMRKKEWPQGYRPDTIPYWTWMHLRARMNAQPSCSLPRALKPGVPRRGRQAQPSASQFSLLSNRYLPQGRGQPFVFPTTASELLEYGNLPPLYQPASSRATSKRTRARNNNNNATSNLRSSAERRRGANTPTISNLLGQRNNNSGSGRPVSGTSSKQGPVVNNRTFERLFGRQTNNSLFGSMLSGGGRSSNTVSETSSKRRRGTNNYANLF